jgi:predicted nucleotidyltransferase
MARFLQALSMPESLAPYRAEIIRLCAAHQVRRLDLFGSARGKSVPSPASDVDFLVEFEPLPPAEYARQYFSLREALICLLGREVDLVVERAVRNPYFLASLQNSREPLFAAA